MKTLMILALTAIFPCTNNAFVKNDMNALTADVCSVQIFEDENFGDTSLILNGPAQYANMRGLPGAGNKDWGDQIDSIITGPNCWVIVYEDENYEDSSMIIGPGSRIAHLGSMGDNIDSIRIFDHNPQ